MLILLYLSLAYKPALAQPVILVMGDSLSAAFGINPNDGWVNLLQQRLDGQRSGYQVVNASVSGETTAGGLNRLPRLLNQHRPEIVILELGANDGLRGLPLIGMKSNLSQMIEQSLQAGARVLILGMKLPPNYGPAYTHQFHENYLSLAKRFQQSVVPFFLDKVALRPELVQADGLHPTKQAQSLLLETVWPQLIPLLPQEHKHNLN